MIASEEFRCQRLLAAVPLRVAIREDVARATAVAVMGDRAGEAAPLVGIALRGQDLLAVAGAPGGRTVSASKNTMQA